MFLSKSKFAILISGMASIALAASSFIIQVPAANSTVSFSVPASPNFKSAKAVAGGIQVSWDKVSANPPVTNYIVTAGPGSCPVMMDAFHKYRD